MFFHKIGTFQCIYCVHKSFIYQSVALVSMRQYSSRVNLLSKMFQPINLIPKGAHVKPEEISSKSQKLMLDLGIIRHAAPAGTFCLLPFGLRAFNKLVKLVDRELEGLGAQKLLLPTLTAGSLWKKSGRWQSSGTELFRLQDRNNQPLVVSPTHEEAVTDLVASLGHVSYRQLPLLLYQISPKFRDEAKPRSGLLRAREFIMKDLYTFDTDLEAAQNSYQLVRDAYHRIFKSLGVKYVTVSGDASSMGGSASEEFHYPSEIGEDELSLCSNCGHGANSELITDTSTCPSCGEDKLQSTKGIEVGHCFILGTHYSKPLNACYLGANGKPVPFHMGCHGLGLSRILAATLECLSTPDALRWPLPLAPFTVCIIPPKEGSVEAAALESAEKLYNALDSFNFLQGEILVDDRGSMTIGRRLRDANRTGYPFVIVAGKPALGPNPVFELHNLQTGEMMESNFESVVDFIKEKTSHL